MSDTSNPRATRYLKLLKTAADRHHTVPTDTRAIYEAGLILAHEDQTAQMVAGEKIDIATYLRLGEELAKLIPPPEPVEVKIQFVNPTETMCPECGCQFDPDTPERMIEKKEAAKIAALPSSTAPAVENGPPAASEVQASAPVPARPAPPIPVPVNPPPKPVHNSATAEWERQRGYGRSARDGGEIRGAAIPHQDPNLPGSMAKYENYNNSAPSCWTGYMGRPSNPATPDINPNYNSDGSPRVAHKAPY